MDPQVESRIAQWRAFVSRRPAIAARDVDELESHLRDRIDDLSGRGLSDEEAFLVAIGRLGRLDDLSREYAREHSDRLWKQLVLDEEPVAPRTGLAVALVLAGLAAVAVKAPALLGAGAYGDAAVRNLPLLVLPFLAVLFLVRRRVAMRTTVAVLATFVVVGAVEDLYPFGDGAATGMLAAVHGAVILWFAVGLAYCAGDWRSARARMDFIRFTGEWFVYFVLLGLGGGVLAALTVGVFSAIGLDPGVFVSEWLLPCGAAGAVVVAGWLVEAKQSVIENIAPVLTKVFTPLFTALLIALIVAGIIQGNLVVTQRDLLIVFDVVLLVVLGLLLYSLSARDPDAQAGWFDRLQLGMVCAALVVDVLVLVAMVGRIGAFGATPNKLASLGLNLILFVALAGAAWLQVRFVRHRVGFSALERWQTSYVPVYLAWALIVVIVFPPVFGFR